MSYLEQYRDQVNDFVEVCHRLAEHMYATSHGGNMAWKLEENLLLITPTKVHKGNIQSKDLVFIDSSGKTVEGTRKPTGETPMYLTFFQERPDITTVIHCHPPYTNTFAITKGENLLMRPIFPETTTEVGPVALVPYAEPLTQTLADNFLPYLKKYNAFLMENHGLVIMSRGDIKWTLMLTEMLETSSISILQAFQTGGVKEMSKQDVLDLDNTMKTRNLPLFGVPGENQSLVDLYFQG